MTGDLARRFYEAGGKVEWREAGGIYCALLHNDGWVVRATDGSAVGSEGLTDHEADCLCRCKMLDDLAKPLGELRISPVKVLDLFLDPDALLRAWEEVCCDT